MIVIDHWAMWLYVVVAAEIALCLIQAGLALPEYAVWYMENHPDKRHLTARQVRALSHFAWGLGWFLWASVPGVMIISGIIDVWRMM